MTAISASRLVYRLLGPLTEFLLGHPGGPLWARNRVAYLEGSEALRRILPSQAPLIDEVLVRLGERG